VTEQRRDRVFVDANELFPFAVMDVILALAEDLVIDFVWSDELLTEWERVIVCDGRRTPDSARAVADAVRAFFASSRIDPSTYRREVANTPGRDLDDRVHTAASIGAKATALLTKNQRDFPKEHLDRHGVVLTTADAFLADLLRRRPADVLASVRRLAARKRHPPRTPCDLADGLHHAQATRFAKALTIRLGCRS
jgi:predicted nucleic acid-binding protein